MSKVFNKISDKNIHRYAANQLELLILNGVFKPNEKLFDYSTKILLIPYLFGEKFLNGFEIGWECLVIGYAIAYAFELAKAEDCILIAGKGHEMYQELKGTMIPFNDRKVAEELIKKRFHLNQ